MAALAWLAAHRALLVGLLGVAMSAVTTLHVLVVPRQPRSAAGWLAVIWLSPIVGPVVYLLLGINRIARAETGIAGLKTR